MKRPYSKNFLSVTVLIVALSTGLSLVGCNSSTPTDQESPSASPTTEGTAPSPSASPQANTGGESDPFTVGMTDSDRPSTDPLELFNNEQIQKELNLSQEQVTKLNEINQEFRQELGKITSGLNLANLDPEAQKAKLDEIQPQIEEQIQATRQKVSETLTPDQLTRYKGITLQIYGWGVFTSDEFVDELKLTDEQKTELAKLREQMLTEMRANWQPPTSNDEQERQKAIDENRKRMEKIIESTNDEALALLTPEQQKSLDTLKGEKFEFNPQQPGS
jgi:Spy/CpxP family protein refolding chaperone